MTTPSCEKTVKLGDFISFTFTRPNRTFQNVSILASVLMRHPDSLFTSIHIEGRYVEFRFFTKDRVELCFHRFKRELRLAEASLCELNVDMVSLFTNRQRNTVFHQTLPVGRTFALTRSLQRVFAQGPLCERMQRSLLLGSETEASDSSGDSSDDSSESVEGSFDSEGSVLDSEIDSDSDSDFVPEDERESRLLLSCTPDD